MWRRLWRRMWRRLWRRHVAPFLTLTPRRHTSPPLTRQDVDHARAATRCRALQAPSRLGGIRGGGRHGRERRGTSRGQAAGLRLDPAARRPRFAARLLLPAYASADPVPGILEYPAVPAQRRHRHARRRDAPLGAPGYACARVDMRGTGDSDGLLEDEYLAAGAGRRCSRSSPGSRAALVHAAVGIIGISWGGFNASRSPRAARRPSRRLSPSAHRRPLPRRRPLHRRLRAGQRGAHWASYLLHMTVQPPHSPRSGERWRELWRARVEAPPCIDPWLAHQRCDAYWKQGSVVEDFAASRCPF